MNLENPFFIAEIVILGIVILIQFSHTYLLYIKILLLEKIFNHPLEISSEDINDKKIAVVKTSSNNEVLIRIQDSLNAYLTNNYGAAVNFSIIKDIIDREVEVKDEEISQSIPIPLYLGLAATMIGIIFGLLAMPKVNSTEFSLGINALINGVQYAMIASLIGLILTTLLSSLFYKKAKRFVQKGKNDQLTYLQVVLLPELIKAEDTGVSGLKASLDRFAREATKITTNVQNASNQTSMNLSAQLDIIKKVESLDVTKVSRANLELFKKLDANMEVYNNFSTYLYHMNKISENMLEFSKRTSNIENVMSEIQKTVKESGSLMEFLTIHLAEIKNAGGAALNAVDLSDSHFKEAIDKLTVETTNRISLLNNLSDNSESALKETFNNIGEKLNSITKEHLSLLTAAYTNSIPHFNHLDNLKELPQIKESSSVQTNTLIHAINELNKSLSNIIRKLDNPAVLSKLDSMEKKLNKKTSSASNVPNERNFIEKISSKFFKKRLELDEKR